MQLGSSFFVPDFFPRRKVPGEIPGIFPGAKCTMVPGTIKLTANHYRVVCVSIFSVLFFFFFVMLCLCLCVCMVDAQLGNGKGGQEGEQGQ
jgi:hypothetical protein